MDFTNLLTFSLGVVISSLAKDCSKELKLLRALLHSLLNIFKPSLRLDYKVGSPWGAFSLEQTPKSGSLLQSDASPLTRKQVEAAYLSESWQRQAYDAFVSTLLAKDRVFPCVYATKGYKANEQRFLFLDSEDLSSPSNVSAIAAALLSYLPKSHEIGPNTSLAILCPPPQDTYSVETYHTRYWAFLKSLRSIDPKPWPAEYPEDTNSDRWCFCFNGIPTFTVVQTPAHQQRQSRYAPNLSLVIQPKWIFDVLFSSPKKREGALGKVRSLLKEYDEIPLSPELKNYGDEGSRESQQYFLLDENKPASCPYSNLTL